MDSFFQIASPPFRIELSLLLQSFDFALHHLVEIREGEAILPAGLLHFGSPLACLDYDLLRGGRYGLVETSLTWVSLLQITWVLRLLPLRG